LLHIPRCGPSQNEELLHRNREVRTTSFPSKAFRQKSTPKAETMVYLSTAMDHYKISDNRRTRDNMISDKSKISDNRQVQTAHKSYVMLLLELGTDSAELPR
jgi:hypothetical protein